MGEFRIGRKSAQHFYPERARGTALALARNFASGPEDDTGIVGGGGTQIPWSAIASGAPAGVHVPITPKSTGIILVVAVFTAKNSSSDPVVLDTIQLNVQINDVSMTIPATVQHTIVDAQDTQAIQVMAKTSALPIGVTANISILATQIAGSNLSVLSGTATLELQEVSDATG